MIITLATAYTMEESVKANGIVTNQDSAIFQINEKLMFFNPFLKDPLSTHPLAIPAPTTPIT